MTKAQKFTDTIKIIGLSAGLIGVTFFAGKHVGNKTAKAQMESKQKIELSSLNSQHATELAKLGRSINISYEHDLFLILHHFRMRDKQFNSLMDQLKKDILSSDYPLSKDDAKKVADRILFGVYTDNPELEDAADHLSKMAIVSEILSKYQMVIEITKLRNESMRSVIYWDQALELANLTKANQPAATVER